jgi:hypothetical protein
VAWHALMEDSPVLTGRVPYNGVKDIYLITWIDIGNRLVEREKSILKRGWD